MLLLSSLVLMAQLQAATVDLQVSPDSAVVEARYEFTDLQPVIFVLIRQPDQVIEAVDIRGGQATTEEATGLLRLTVLPTGTEIRVTYLVHGRLIRIPVPVPDRPSSPGQPRVRIHIRGLPADSHLDRSFPRLVGEEPSVAGATLANVPSLVRLPPHTGKVSVTQAAEWFVILLVGVSSAVWMTRARKRRGAP